MNKVSHVNTLEKDVPSRRNSKCKDPELRSQLVIFEEHSKVNLIGAEWTRKSVVVGMFKGEARGQIIYC